MQMIFRNQHVQRVVFSGKPSDSDRVWLKENGFRYNGDAWYRKLEQVSSTTIDQLKELVTPLHEAV